MKKVPVYLLEKTFGFPVRENSGFAATSLPSYLTEAEEVTNVGALSISSTPQLPSRKHFRTKKPPKNLIHVNLNNNTADMVEVSPVTAPA